MATTDVLAGFIPLTDSALLVAAREDRLTEGLIAAVDAVGAVLAQHVPPRPGDVDELSNKVILL